MYFLNFNDGFIEVPFASPSLNIYTLGCEHHCKGCHAPDLQNFNHENKQNLTFKLLKKKLNAISGFYKSVCWLGGDPFFQFEDCYKISKELKNEFPNIINVVYTGYDWKEFFKTLDDKAYIEQPYNLPFDYIIDGQWNGKMLGQNGCNQKIWWNNPFLSYVFTFTEISYENFKKGNKLENNNE